VTDETIPTPPPMAALLRARRFGPLFLAQFLGAFAENAYRQAMAVLLVYGASGGSAASAALASGTFVLPFVLLSTFAGRLADVTDKARLARGLRLAGLGLAALGGLAILSGSVPAMFACLFLIGCQSALFGPAKYALLPEHLREGELVAGNALVEAGTFLAILLGGIAGGLILDLPGGGLSATAGLVGLSAAAWLAALAIPPAPPVASGPVPWGELAPRAVATRIREARGRRASWLCILGLSWFWALGGALVSLVPALVHDAAGGGAALTGIFLGAFSVGIGAGSLLCARQLRGRLTAVPVPFSALVTAGLLLLLAGAVGAMPEAGRVSSAVDLLSSPSCLAVLALLAATAASTAYLAVPLFALLQHGAEPGSRAVAMGVNNLVNAAAMVASAGLVALLAGPLGLPLSGLILTFSGLSLVAALVATRLLSRQVLKAVVRAILSRLYRVEVVGEGNFARAGARRIVVANHLSFLDGLVVAAFLPGDPVFAVNTHIARKWWARPLLSLVDFAAIDPTNPLGLKALAREVEAGRTLVIYPEGRLTVTGSLMKVYDGPGLVADRTGADIVPVRLDGLQYTPFTRLGDRVSKRLFPRVRMTVLPPCRIEVDPAVRGRARRKAVGRRLYDVMSESLFASTDIDRTLFRALQDARRLHGRSAPIAEDAAFEPIGYGRLVAGSVALGRHLARTTGPGEAVGLLLPNSVGALVAFFALQATGRVPAMLNLSTGAAGMLSACRTAQVATVVTARRFVEQAKLHAVIAAMEGEVRVLYLDDERGRIRLADKLAGLAHSLLPLAPPVARDPGDPAVILFTSGSEGAPKGVVLSHRNLQANRVQVSARIAFNNRDVVFNAMPMFHSFGLTVGTLLPVLSGIRTFLYPSPLHYRIVAELVYQTNATVLFGTDTFLRGYAKAADPYDFHSLRLVGAGAERVTDEARRVYADRFGLRILEGYGATECAPVVAFNTPMHFRAGSVGRLMPGMVARLEPVPGIAGGGRLHVAGPNVMLGYMLADEPGVLRPSGGWHDTGDIVDLDAEGYVTIKGRAKRFAKVAGEMVSLGAVEELAAAVAPEARHAAVTRPDPRKGEAVTLLSEDPGLTRRALQEAAGLRGIPEVMLPREVLHVAVLPLLGTGKTDYPAAERLVRDRLAEAAAADLDDVDEEEAA